jgi:DNA invertase Pin-like site-specific DNA recombinase
MAIHGYLRCTGPKDENRSAIEWEIKRMERKAQELGGKLENVFLDTGDSAKRTAVLGPPADKVMLGTPKAGDTLIVTQWDRLGYSGEDLQRTVKTLADREITIVAVGDHGVADPVISKFACEMFALYASSERNLPSERMTEVAEQRKAAGLAYGSVPMGKKIVVRDGVKHLAWDHEQLGYIAEIAFRLPQEGAAKVAKDFWRRRIKDRRGLPCGQQVAKDGSKTQLLSRAMRCFLRTYRGGDRYQQSYRASRWFWRMQRKGLLPSPYGPLEEPSALLPEPKRYGLEPKPRKWTRGGTARREQERAEAKVRHRAERQARWRAEKVTRVQSRVYKPMAARLGAAPVLGDGPAKEESHA